MTVFLLKNEPASVLCVASLTPAMEVGIAKASLNGRLPRFGGVRAAHTRPETGWATLVQDESRRNARGGPNPRAVQNAGMR